MLENYVTSFVEGRVRLRHPVFKDEAMVEQIIELLQNMPGVESIKHNKRTGSLLLKYDEDKLDQETLVGLISQGDQWLSAQGYELNNIEPKKTCLNLFACNLTTREKRKIYNRSMATFLGISAIAIGLGNERVHAVAGCLFLALSLGHIKRMHKSLL